MTTTDYELDAKERLAKCGGTIRINRSDKKSPPWEDKDPRHRPHYRVTLCGQGGNYSFDFWGSINDGETGRLATAYDVLACLEWNTPQRFEDFCSEFGYDTDSRMAHKIWMACRAQTAALERIFPAVSSRQCLAEIR